MGNICINIGNVDGDLSYIYFDLNYFNNYFTNICIKFYNYYLQINQFDMKIFKNLFTVPLYVFIFGFAQAQTVTGDLVVPEFCNATIKFYENVGGIPTLSVPHTIDLNSLQAAFNCGGGNNAKPNGVAMNNDDLFVAITAGCQRVYKFPAYYNDPANAIANVSQITNIASDYVGIAFSANGNELYTTEGSWLNTELVRYTGANFSTRTVIGNAGMTSYLANIAIDVSGNVWVTDYSNERLVVFDAANLGTTNTWHQMSNYVAPNNIPVGNIISGLTNNVNKLLSSPEGIAFDNDGNLWLANNDDNNGNSNATLVKITANLQSNILLSSPSYAPNLLEANSTTGYFIYNMPVPANFYANCFVGVPWHAQLGGLQVDKANGKIYVTEQAGNDLLVFDISTIESLPNNYADLNLGLLTTNAGNGGIYFRPSVVPCSNAIDDVCSLFTIGSLTAGSTIYGIQPFNNECATTETGEPVPTNFSIDNTVWLTFDTPATQYSDVRLTITSIPYGASFGIDAQVAVYESSDGTCTGIFTEKGSAADPTFFDETLELQCLTPNTTYFVQVDGSTLSPQGYFTISVEDITTPSSVCNVSPPTTTEFIKIDQFGYLPDAQKIAVVSDPQVGYNAADAYACPATLEVRDWNTDATVFIGASVQWKSGTTHAQSGDNVWWFDFSSLTATGEYYIYDAANNTKSYKFEIGNTVYDNALKESARSYFYQRCGHAKNSPYADTGYTDNVCHAGSLQDGNCRLYTGNDPATSKDLSGGWHDAGDYNKYVNFAWRPLVDLLLAYEDAPCAWGDNYNIPESGNGVADLLDEVKYELDWLLRMQNIDGGVLSVVGVKNYASASPPSSDAAQRFYGPATTSASFSAAAMFALGAIQFEAIGQTAYANQLETAAIDAYNWGVANPSTTFYNSGLLAAGEQEVDTYERSVRKMSAAIFLYAKTGNTVYKTYVENNYLAIHLLDWWFAYPFETAIQDALLYYAKQTGVSTTVRDNINNRFAYSMNTGNNDNLYSYNTDADAYRAFLKDANYTWGSNTTKGGQGNMFLAMLLRGLAGANVDAYKGAAGGFVHYFHGVNPNAKVYLSNMYAAGAENAVNQLYHAWFTDGSADWDEVGVSNYGPAPGFVVGGPNPSYSLDGCCPGTCGNPAANALCATNVTPPLNQPIQKSYKDFNEGWPINSWEVTEPGIYSNSAYVRMLGNYIGHMLELPATCAEACPANLVIDDVPISPNTYKAELTIASAGTVAAPANVQFEAGESISLLDGFHAEAGCNFVASIVPCVGNLVPQHTFSKQQFGNIGREALPFDAEHANMFSIVPNPASNKAHIVFKKPIGNAHIGIYDSRGQLVFQQRLPSDAENGHWLNLEGYAKGLYFVRLKTEGGNMVEKLVVH
jgi:endoglucanase